MRVHRRCPCPNVENLLGGANIYIGIHVRAKENKRTEKKKKNKQQYAYDLHRSRSAIVRFPRSLVPDIGIIIDDSSKMEFTRSNDNSRNSSSSNHWSYHDRSLFTFFTDTIIIRPLSSRFHSFVHVQCSSNTARSFDHVARSR